MKLTPIPVIEFTQHRTLVIRTKLVLFHPLSCKQIGMMAVLTYKAFQVGYKIKMQCSGLSRILEERVLNS